MDGQHKMQKVIFVRHGIALHNVVDPQALEGGTSSRRELFDPPLTSDGMLQAVMVGETIQGWIRQQRRDSFSLHPPRLIVMISPLTRCLQTALYAFGTPNDFFSDSTFLCLENLREACGMHRCDARRTKSELQQCWELNNFRVQFSPTMSERDELWSSRQRETIPDLQRRIHDFLSFLITFNDPVTTITSEINICTSDDVVFIIVTHGVWIETLLRVYHAPYHLLYNQIPNPTGADATTPTVVVPKRVYNGDAYYCECISSSPGRNLQLQRVQNFHQICGATSVPSI